MHAALLAITVVINAQAPDPPATLEKIATIDNEKITESSGVAPSYRSHTLLWTHNDSGDGPHLYAVNVKGQSLARVTIKNTIALDWEDLCSFVLDEKPMLLAGDLGDNRRIRPVVTLHLLEEPNLAKANVDAPLELKVEAQAIHLKYPDGSHDCEGLAVDVGARMIYVLTKANPKERAALYATPIPREPPTDAVELKRVANVNAKWLTAMDFSPDGRHAVTMNAGGVYLYERSKDQVWAQTFATKPARLCKAPRRAEAACFAADGKGLWVTTEGRNPPLYHIALDQDAAKPRR